MPGILHWKYYGGVTETRALAQIRPGGLRAASGEIGIGAGPGAVMDGARNSGLFPGRWTAPCPSVSRRPCVGHRSDQVGRNAPAPLRHATTFPLSRPWAAHCGRPCERPAGRYHFLSRCVRRWAQLHFPGKTHTAIRACPLPWAAGTAVLSS